MGYHDILFPLGISEGSSGGPQWKTDIAALPSGVEERTSRWARPRWRYDVRQAIRTPDEARALVAFYLARRGSANSFRFRDPIDYSSAANGTGAPAASDQVLGVGDGTTTRYQIRKRYEAGDFYFDRLIRKPVEGSVVASASGTSSHTVDYTTGEIIFNAPVTDGATATCGFLFDVPVRFALEEGSEEWLAWAAQSDRIFDLESITLLEDLDPAPISGASYMGGARSVTMTGTVLAISAAQARVWDIDPAGASRVVILPNPANIPTGGPIFFVFNAGANSFAIQDHLGNAVATTPSAQTSEILLSVNSGGQKIWRALTG